MSVKDSPVMASCTLMFHFSTIAATERDKISQESCLPARGNLCMALSSLYVWHDTCKSKNTLMILPACKERCSMTMLSMQIGIGIGEDGCLSLIFSV